MSMVTSAEQSRNRILEAAARLFDERGLAGVTARDVASEAGVSARTVSRHFPDLSDLFAEVVTARAGSTVSDDLVRQTRDESGSPMGALLWAAREVFAAPERNWSALELEAFAAAHRDPDVAELMRSRIGGRWTAMEEVVRRMQEGGVIDDSLDSDALIHFSLVLSVGLALADSVVPVSVDERKWTGLMSRLLTALGPVPLSGHAAVSTDRLWRIRVDVPDRIGAVEQLARTLTSLNAFVIMVVTPGDDTDEWRTIDLLVSCPDSLGAAELRDSAGAVGRNVYVREGSDEDRLDVATRVLDGVAEIIRNPRGAPEQIARLVEADSYEFADAVSGSDDASDVLRLQWTPTRHVVLRRAWAPFMRSEQMRASAAMRLASTMASSAGDLEALGWVEPMRGGGTVWMRFARPEDVGAVTTMHERCSERTIHQRYFRNITEWRELTMRRLAGGHRGASIVVMAEDGRIVGLGNVFPIEEDARSAELALIIDDDHQAHGLGARLLDHMIAIARQLGFDTVVASVLAENRGMISLLDRTGLSWTRHVESGVTEFSAPLF